MAHCGLLRAANQPGEILGVQHAFLGTERSILRRNLKRLQCSTFPECIFRNFSYIRRNLYLL